jgi:hypothetical protein
VPSRPPCSHCIPPRRLPPTLSPVAAPPPPPTSRYFIGVIKALEDLGVVGRGKTPCAGASAGAIVTTAWTAGEGGRVAAACREGREGPDRVGERKCGTGWGGWISLRAE